MTTPGRGRLTLFVARHRLAWEGTMAALAVAYAVLGAWDDDFGGDAPAALLVAFSALFLLEFGARCLDAPSRAGYAREHWLDLASSIPLVSFLRPLRLLRLLRLAGAFRALGFAEAAQGRHGLGYLFPSVLFVWLSGAYAIWVVERPYGTIHSFADALYWSLITISTIGYGDVRDLSPTGRVVSGLLAIVGVAVVGLLSAELTSRWIRREDATAAQLAALRTELAALREVLEADRAGAWHPTSPAVAGRVRVSPDRDRMGPAG